MQIPPKARTLLFTGLLASVFHGTAQADSTEDPNEQQRALLKRVWLDLLVSDGIAEAEEKFTNRMEGKLEPLSDRKRKKLTQSLLELFPKLEADQPDIAALAVGSGFTFIGMDGVESEEELALVELYREALAPNLTMADCRRITTKTQMASRRKEAPYYLGKLRTHAIAFSKTGGFTDIPQYPSLSSDMVRWNKADSGGFADIGFEVDGSVRSSFRLQATNQGKGFIATAFIDADKDSQFAVFVVTETSTVTMVTPEDVY
jgi:hypothetical protein